MRCHFSGEEIYISIDPSIPVECPDCGAIRTIQGKYIYSDMIKYPSHNKADMVRVRKCYRRVNRSWILEEGGEK